jgi:hypothetical protein
MTGLLRSYPAECYASFYYYILSHPQEPKNIAQADEMPIMPDTGCIGCGLRQRCLDFLRNFATILIQGLRMKLESG